jgi:hypothetical protein
MQQPSGGLLPPPVPSPAPVVAGDPGAFTYTLTLPKTQRDIEALRERRSELSNQLESAADRRAEIAEEIKATEGAVRAGLEQRVALLDERILQLEKDIAETGRQLTSAPAGLLAATEEDPFANMQVNEALVEKVSIMFVLFVLAPLAVSAAYLMFRRANRPAPQSGSRGDSERLQRLESAVDTIAVEIERISEGQRFVTKLLTESPPQPALTGRQGQHARIGSTSESE